MVTESWGMHARRNSRLPRGLSRLEDDAVAMLASLVVHLGVLVGLGVIPMLVEPALSLVITVAPEVPLTEEELLPAAFAFSDRPLAEVGANSAAGTEMALSGGELLAPLTEIPAPAAMRPVEIGRFETSPAIEVAAALRVDNLPVRGSGGEGVTGAMGAVDRLTHEILLSLEERPTLVVWLFDQSASLARQRQQIHARLDRIYAELGVAEAAEHAAFRPADSPLLTAVMAFGSHVSFPLGQPTDDVAVIKESVAGIPLDDSGVERVFSAINAAAQRYRRYRVQRPQRNVVLVVFTDEAGEDQQGVEQCVTLCRRLEMPVFVVGVPAPFGRRETLVKWVDPDPNYDQSPQWGVVDQGPESMMIERVQLSFLGGRDPDPMDSGFGPFALTRLCYETGGMYFAVHPNRNDGREVGRRETAEFSAHLKYFFDPEVMRKYRPDYVSESEYARRVQARPARGALIRAAAMSRIDQLEEPRTRFVKRSEAELVAALTEAQKAAAILEPRIQLLYETLSAGQEDRRRESSPRWQAGYDLALGRVLAAKVRTEGYNGMLALAKRGLTFTQPKSNTWVLRPAAEVAGDSRLARDADGASARLHEVIRQHPGTPWELLARAELETPMSWRWVEQFTDLSPPRPPARPNNRPRRPARDERPRVVTPPPPKRPPPKL